MTQLFSLSFEETFPRELGGELLPKKLPTEIK